MKPTVNYLYELGQLKRVRRSGWWLAGVDAAESVAEHSFRVAAIAYVLAEREGADPEKAAAMALFHDAAETRVNDSHGIAKRYIDWGRAEKDVLRDQLSGLPPGLRERLRQLHEERAARTTPEARVAKDADRLECLLQAREYAAAGYAVDEWIQSSVEALSTAAAREIAREALETSPSAWREPTGR